MNSLLKIFLYIAVVLLLGVLLSPPIYWASQSLQEAGWLNMLHGFPFFRYFNRTIQVIGLVLLIPLILWLRIFRLEDMGLQKNPNWKKDLFIAFLISFFLLLALDFGYLLSGVYRFKELFHWQDIIRIAGTAMVVSFLEEIFFRGFLLGIGVRAFGKLGGAIFSAAVFAGLHFLRSAKTNQVESVTWLSGWAQLLLVSSGAPEWPLLAYSAGTLLLVGLLLAAVTLRTQSLALAMGLHAGWIFGMQGFQVFAKFQMNPPNSGLPWVGPNVISGAVPTGLVPAGAVLLTGIIIWLWIRRRC